MRYFLVFFAFFLSLSSAKASPIPTTTVDRLPNGVRVILQEDKSKPKISAAVLVRTDKYPQTYPGLSHFVQHVILAGKNIKSFEDTALKYKVARREDTVEDAAFFEGDMPSAAIYDHLSELRVALDSIDTSKAVMETAKADIKKETNGVLEHSPLTILSGFLYQKAFRDQSYAHTVAGSDKQIEGTTADLVEEYYKQNYVSDNFTISVVGDFETAKLLAHIKKVWGNFPDKKAKEPVQIFYRSYEEKNRHETKIDGTDDRSTLLLGYEMPDSRHTDTAALDVLCAILEGQDFSLLDKDLVPKKAFQVMATNSLSLRPHLFVIGALGESNVKPEELRKKIVDTLQRISEDPKNSPWEKARDKTLESFYNHTSDRADLAKNLAVYDVFYGSYLSYYGRSEEYKKVNFHDIQRVLYRYFLVTKPHEFVLTQQKPNI